MPEPAGPTREELLKRIGEYSAQLGARGGGLESAVLQSVKDEVVKAAPGQCRALARQLDEFQVKYLPQAKAP